MKKILFILLIFNIGNLVSQTTVNSLQALLPYLIDSNANVKLAPGTYSITAADVAAGDFSNPLLLFEGNNSAYDFTNVTINIDTEVLSSFGNVDVNLLQILGNNNTLKNLKLVNVGNNAPRKRAQTIVMDGSDNLLEGFHMTVRGSYPYGYGDAFGKGGGPVIGHRKHSALLVRGESNHVKNCTLIHRSYGHAIFMQAASNPIIEGCYIEGEMRSTDDMLKEEGTGSPADNVDFMTVWGYRLPSGYMMSTGEGGIRAYNAGTTFINGETIERGTSNPTVRNCTIKHMRTGVVLAHASGTVIAKNCTAIGCEQGFGLGSGTAINCKADISHGHAFKSTYDNDSWDLDIEIIPAVDPYYNGQKCIAFIGMDNSNLTLTGGDPNLPSDYRIQIGGTLDGVRFKNGNLDYQSTHNGKNNKVINNTKHPIVIASGSTGSSIETCGSVTDNGSNNSITNTNDCESQTSFTPNPNKTYYIDSPVHNLRLASNGSSEDPYTTSTQTTGDDVIWKFVDKGNGFWHIQRAAGGAKPRLRTDNSEFADMQATSYSGTYTYYNFTQGVSSGTHFLTLPDGPSGRKRLQINSEGLVRFMSSSLNGTWESFTITEVNTNTSSSVVHITKRNAPGYAIDAPGKNPSNGDQVYLWSTNPNNPNQQWIEIDRGNGYYSYQKIGADYCIDGMDGGTNRQDVYLWNCSDNNWNQQWQKVAVGGGAYKLIKRNESGFAINGGSNGADGQNVNLFDSSNTSQNLQWIITPIDVARAPELSNDEAIFSYPNPVENVMTIQGAKDSTIRIYDMNGKIVRIKNIVSNNETLDLSSLSAGIYYAKINGLYSFSTIKIVKK
ncbi:T9SS type A sorting domain-containing protein [uncultured Aquimarina sp.]|uniref:T9SS type A sorting domain-containing protein n=1 Tax=uncultured Aquimarina sp. TaxID=575652 RepID=UPI00262B8C36|nr:T9SS type A sorting domain-containing protein [uncultured Aquimarina sp.]